MAVEVVMPDLGVGRQRGRLVRWLRREGERVTAGEPLFDVEADLAVVRVPSPGAGVLSGIRVREGEEAAVGAVLAYLLAPAARPPGAGTGPEGPRPAASPLARRLAAERGLDLSSVGGTGPGGAVVEADVRGVLPAASPAADVEITRGARWQAMAESAARSWAHVPHVFLLRDTDASQLLAARARHGAGVTETDLLVRLVAVTLAEHPLANAGSRRVNVALSIAVEDGVVVPVIEDADRLHVAALAARRADLAERARAGRLAAAELAEPTFTIASLVGGGADAVLPVVPEGQAAILAAGRIADRVVAVAGRPAVRPVLTLTLACDHRLLDATRGAAFLADLTAAIEEPASRL